MILLRFLIAIGAGLFGVSGVTLAGDGACRLPARIIGDVKLHTGCTYNGSIVISSSDTVLDCQGAILDGQNLRETAISISGRGKQIQNVTVKNCQITGFNGRVINVTSGVPKWRLLTDVHANYDVAPKHVIIDGVQVSGGRGGVYFDSYVNGSILRNSIVRGADKVGVYLEQGTRDISILNNKILDNGALTRREGLAIDSSAHNVVRGNLFQGNAAGGIFIYKNCGENFNSGKSVLRWQSSDYNEIMDNEFRGQPVGVWVASRQSRNLSKWGCGDRALDQQGRYYEDFANHNVVQANRFCGVKVPVRVEGDHNVVSNNKSDVRVAEMVLEPFKFKAKPDGRMTVGNRFEANSSFVCD
ncbi:right-handed parallel beta-helix repeat-containing protein [Pseudomonas sp. BP8]|uniref:right-handed parallel beta-helix repeat-containing protein n=1 Tax=Pseudomonas sp. BP8 TaxID=2817864 RepID=UPI001AE506C5|nr:right-handed parallel beta-helix repeat-containing protein [Pseudomonas sp. BP8]MBP2263658.1 parallel beta-helix repeat protein [Pseudomonas sp. BP8]HDS1736311.1 right-handed parallel beta-helix repeat-containing protein [Pseudomonas putida]